MMEHAARMSGGNSTGSGCFVAGSGRFARDVEWEFLTKKKAVAAKNRIKRLAKKWGWGVKFVLLGPKGD